MTPSPTSASPSWARLLIRVLGVGLAFALVGVLIGLRTVAITTLPHILQPGPEMNIQEVGDGLPAPHLLDWNLNLLEGLQTLRDLHGAMLFGMGALLFGALGLLTISMLDRTLRLFSTPNPTEKPGVNAAPPLEESAEGDSAASTAEEARGSREAEALEGALDMAQLGRVLLRLLAVGIPVGAIWWVADLLPPGPIPTAVRYLGLGLAVWLVLRREPEEAAPAWGRLAQMGALFGAGLGALALCAMPAPSAELMAQFHTLGPFRCDIWDLLAGRLLFSQGLAWFGAGALLVLLSRSDLRLGQRVGLLVLPIAAGLLALLAQRPFSAAAMAARYDATPEVLQTAVPYDPTKATSGVPAGQAAARELAQRLNLPIGAQPASPDHSLVLFLPPEGLAGMPYLPQSPATVRISGYTEMGLTATPDTIPTVLDFLKRRDYRTALAWAANKHLCDIAAKDLDQTAQIVASFRDLENCPHPKQLTDGLEGMLFTCAASPENLALLDHWADEARFAHPDRESKVLMGRMYERVGETEKALLWYQKAEMPRSFMARVRTSPPNFHEGVVTGVLRLNGHPL
ncbi:MAG TPA: hypothetical protein VKU00_04055, partial [Chthonomonadaceae bacterium]|nr:hypothetical protein [Chthonomonadaceae bacterium]